MQTHVFGAPQACAFIATIIGSVIGSMLLFSRANETGSKRLLVGSVAWFFYLYLVWGAAGFWSGRSFWAAGLDPLLLIVRTLPALLKAL